MQGTAQSTADGGRGVVTQVGGRSAECGGRSLAGGQAGLCLELICQSGGGQQGSTGQCSVELRVRRMSLGEEESHA